MRFTGEYQRANHRHHLAMLFAGCPQAAGGCILVAGRRSDWPDHKARGVAKQYYRGVSQPLSELPAATYQKPILGVSGRIPALFYAHPRSNIDQSRYFLPGSIDDVDHGNRLQLLLGPEEHWTLLALMDKAPRHCEAENQVFQGNPLRQ